MAQVEIPPIGERIRVERLQRGISLRALARQAAVSASLVSQIETGRIRPSVSTLYSLTGALGLSVTDLLEGRPPGHGGDGHGAAGGGGQARGGDGVGGDATTTDSPVVTAGLTTMLASNPVTAREPGVDASDPSAGGAGVFTTTGRREVITLDSGVVWEVMGQLPGEKVDFLRIIYAPGSASSSGELMQHPGTEYGFLQSGRLVAQVGGDERTLSPGDAVCFRSETPHRYRNDGSAPAVGIWVVIDEA